MQHKCSQLVFVRLDKAFMLWYYYGMCNRRVLSSGRVDNYWVRCSESRRLFGHHTVDTYWGEVERYIAELTEEEERERNDRRNAIRDDIDFVGLPQERWATGPNYGEALSYARRDEKKLRYKRGFTPKEVASRVVNYARQRYNDKYSHETGYYDSGSLTAGYRHLNQRDTLFTRVINGETIDG